MKTKRNTKENKNLKKGNMRKWEEVMHIINDIHVKDKHKKQNKTGNSHMETCGRVN